MGSEMCIRDRCSFNDHLVRLMPAERSLQLLWIDLSKSYLSPLITLVDPVVDADPAENTSTTLLDLSSIERIYHTSSGTILARSWERWIVRWGDDNTPPSVKRLGDLRDLFPFGRIESFHDSAHTVKGKLSRSRTCDLS